MRKLSEHPAPLKRERLFRHPDLRFHWSKPHRKSCHIARTREFAAFKKLGVWDPLDYRRTSVTEVAMCHMHPPRMAVQVRILKNKTIEPLLGIRVRNYEHLDIAHHAGEGDKTAQSG